MRAEVVLTVSESKRLIAKAVVALDYVQERLEEGVVVVTTGSTNAYIYEELMDEHIDKRGYLTGRTIPAQVDGDWDVPRMSDLILVDGEPASDLDRFSVLDHMQPGDIYIKGANALNYRDQVAGVSIGDPRGGTVGGVLGTIIGSKLRMVIPVGLEKEIPFNIGMLGRWLLEDDDKRGTVHSLWPISCGIIFTELEAFDLLCNVDAFPVAAGGIAGAEGGLRFVIEGYEKDIEETLELIEEIQGEPSLG